MKLTDLPTGVTDWSTLHPSSQPGATGTATIRGRHVGDRGRLRDADAEHAARGAGRARADADEHGRRYELSAGMAYHVADNERAPHRLTSREGASVFILD